MSIFKTGIGRFFYEGDAGAGGGGGNNANAGAGGAAANGNAAGGAAAASDWTSGLNEDHKGFITNKGIKDPSMLIESYRGVEKLIGVKERIVLKPEKDDDAAGWNDFYNKAGRPEKAEEYDLAFPKEGGNENFEKWAKENFHKAGLNKSQAKNLATAYQEFSKGLVTTQTEERGKMLEKAENEIKKEWGLAYDQNKAIAEKAVKAFGVDQSTLEKLEQAMGVSAAAKFFHSIGSKLGEDKFEGGGGSSGGSVMSPEQAKFRINELKNSKDFLERFGKGDQAAKDELNLLHKYAYPN